VTVTCDSDSSDSNGNRFYVAKLSWSHIERVRASTSRPNLVIENLATLVATTLVARWQSEAYDLQQLCRSILCVN
jgi:hypothetical protein